MKLALLLFITKRTAAVVEAGKVFEKESATKVAEDAIDETVVEDVIGETVAEKAKTVVATLNYEFCSVKSFVDKRHSQK